MKIWNIENKSALGVLLVPVIFGFVFSGCRTNQGRQGEKPAVLVTILPEKTFVEKIADTDFSVEVLVPQGANPAVYSLQPAQMKAIAAAKVWFRMGYVGFESAWGERIGQTNRHMKMVDLSEGLDLISGDSTVVHPGDRGIDPHTWLSPGNVRTISRNILKELERLNPDKAEVYRENWEAFQKEIGQTDFEIKEIFWKMEGKKFITYHPSLTYFARDYGLTQLSVEQGGKEPTPARMAGLVETARKEGIRVIYIQSDYDRELATVFAEEIKGKVVQIEPLNPAWSSNLKTIARQIKEN